MSNRRLLLADDSLTIQKVVILTFSDEGFDVQTVGDGDSALEAIRASAPDIVLADVNMPGADGYSICEQLRRNDATNNIPVILLVGSFEPFDEEKAGLVGANAFLTKPFQSIRQLIAQVNELLESARSTNGHIESKSSAPEPENAPPPDDIDSLYTQSFSADAPTGADDDLHRSMSGFDDSGLDDEMIETSYLASDENSETLDFEIAATSDAAESRREENADLAPGIDQYFSESEQVTTGYETSPLDPFTTHADQSKSFHPQQAETPQIDIPDFPDSLVETVPNFGFDSPEQTESTVPIEPVDEYFRPADSSPFISSETNEKLLEEQIGIETISFNPPEPERRFEEIDLLDLPSIGALSTVELTTAERSEMMGSDKQVMSLSPELMETIVQKVVERLSQKY